MRLELDFKKNIEEMRMKYAELKSLKRLPKAIWLEPEGTLYKTYYEFHQLLKYGEIHYACIVQANMILFKAFPPYNCPANIILSTSEYYDSNPFELNQIANKLYSYKNSNNAPGNLKIVTDSITDEYERLYNIELPYSITKSESVLFTTIMVFRPKIAWSNFSGHNKPF